MLKITTNDLAVKHFIMGKLDLKDYYDVIINFTLLIHFIIVIVTSLAILYSLLEVLFVVGT